MQVYHATLYKTDGTSEKVVPENGRTFTYSELKRFVGGYIEIVALHDGGMMVVNENGKIHNLPFNQEATNLFNAGGRAWYDPIVGNALVVEDLRLLGDDEGDDDDDQPDDFK